MISAMNPVSVNKDCDVSRILISIVEELYSRTSSKAERSFLCCARVQKVRKLENFKIYIMQLFQGL